MHRIIEERVPLVALGRSLFESWTGPGLGVAFVGGGIALDLGATRS